MARSSVNFLPSYYRTDKNTKFLSSTLDQFIEKPQLERLNGYLGSRLTPTFNPSTDLYISDSTATNRKYILEPGLVITDDQFTVQRSYTYDDLIGQLEYHGAHVNNLNRLFKPDYLSFNPQIDWDKLVNFREYYWLPVGPTPISVTGTQREVVSTFTVTDSADGHFFIFTPDGGTESPLVTLYRGVTYVFNVNSKNKNKLYIKSEIGSGTAGLYNINVLNNGTSNGQIIITVDSQTPAVLYYASESDQIGGGELIVKAITENSSINVDEEIVGKASYVSGNNITFVNGLKVEFGGDVLPTTYQNKTYIVEGVGKAIILVDFDLLNTPDSFATNYDDNFDADNFDEFPFDNFKSLPIDPSYVTINRASKDLNPWTRYNRWFHSSVLAAVAQANNQQLELPIHAQAKRPIIEFRPNLQLFNFGDTGVANVDLIDNRTTDAFSLVEGAVGFHIDGVLLEQGNRVIFNADEDPLIRGRIFEVNFVSIDGKRVIALLPTDDTIPFQNSCVAVNKGNNYQSSNWWFNGTQWIFAQQKTSINQAPLFDVFDANTISYGNQSYYTSNFSGTAVFGYQVGTGISDSVLGFPLSYQTNGLESSYLFTNYFDTDTIITAYPSVSQTISVSGGQLKDNTDVNNPAYVNVWTPASSFDIPVIQFQVSYEAFSVIEILVFDTPAFISDLTVDVIINNVKLLKSEYTLSTTGTRLFVNLVNPIPANTKGNTIHLDIFTTTSPNSLGTYAAPINLTNNPVNGTVAQLTLSELSDHVATMIARDPDFVGTYPGLSNLGVLPNAPKYGSRIVVNNNPIVTSQFFISVKENNLIEATKQACDDYNQFKLNLIKTITQLDPTGSPVDLLDSVLVSINQNKNTTFPYFLSDMVPAGTNKKLRNYIVTDTRNVDYAISNVFNPAIITNQAVLVYLNGEHLIINKDYMFNEYEPTVSFLISLQPGDQLQIVEYADTDGSYIAPTPTKLGLYPAFEPQIFLDTTYAGTPQTVIQGHDGSITVAFGDYRDAVLLEYEKRIYNNLKTAYRSELFDINSIMPSRFRSTDYTYDEIFSLVTNQFKKWSNFYGVDYEKNTTFDVDNHKTYNYKSVEDTIFGGIFLGSWRAIYKYYFDTDRPETHPWEMLGITVKPDWWDSYYGPYPYTSGNQKLWADLEAGNIAQGPNAGINPLYARPGLSNIIPVDDAGNIIDIRDWAGIGETGSVPGIDQSWAFGDLGPAETAWRRSSNWPFAVQIILALTKPADYCAKLFDTSRITKNLAGQFVYGGNPIVTGVLTVYGDTSSGNVTRSAGYSVYVVEAGLKKNGNYITDLISQQAYGNIQLVSKLGGFVNKEKLNIVVDSVQLGTQNPSPYLPPEDYQIHFNTSNPIKTIAASGVIVIKSNGSYVVRGYDTTDLYFNVYQPLHQKTDPGITIGGSSEAYLTWASGQSYYAGQIVLYQNTYYRANRNHIAGTTFNVSNYTSLPGLPSSGGVTILNAINFDTEVTQVTYGTAFNSVQEVVDFLFGYGHWLSSQGFIFSDFNNDFNQVVDWLFTVKEFTYWTTQNWADNSVITLSPFANQLQFQFNEGVVDNILDSFYEYNLLRADGTTFPATNFGLFRDNGIFTIKTENTFDGIYFARLHVVQKEHAIIFNNKTIFNDIIYQPESGYRQRRVKVEGFRTANWNGDFISPGFIFDEAKIHMWTPYVDYQPGDVVKFVGKYYSALGKVVGTEKFDFTQWYALPQVPTSRLIPNFDYKINQFEDFYSLDTDNFDAGQQKMAQHLIGYTPRTYLDNIFDNPISQYKFYQGYIREKGTLNSILKLEKAATAGLQGKLDIAEEWAFRVGTFGSFSSFNEIELPLKEQDFIESSQTIELLSTPPSDPNSLISYILPNDVVLSPKDFIPEQTFPTVTGTIYNNNIVLPYAGYVRIDDVTYTAPTLSQLNTNTNVYTIQNADYAQYSTSTVLKYNEGDKVWVAFDNNLDWNVYRHTALPNYVTTTTQITNGLSFGTNRAHGLHIGDIISVSRIDVSIDGVYTVSNIVSLTQFDVVAPNALTSYAGNLSTGVLAKFNTVRFKSVDDMANLDFSAHIQNGELVWVDDIGTGQWAVLKKINNYARQEIFSPRTDLPYQRFGDKIAKQANSSTMVVSADNSIDPVGGRGRIFVFDKLNGDIVNTLNFGLNSVFNEHRPSNDNAPFGDNIFYDETDDLIFASASNASNVTGSNGSSAFTATGVVKISGFYKTYPQAEIPYAVLVDPAANSGTVRGGNGTRFGSGLFVQRQQTNKTVLVGAPKQAQSANTHITISTGTVYRFDVNIVSTADTPVFYTNISGNTPGWQSGVGATFDITVTAGTYEVNINNTGTDYVITTTSTPTFTIPGNNLGGISPRNDLSIIANGVNASGNITGFITRYLDAPATVFTVAPNTQAVLDLPPVIEYYGLEPQPDEFGYAISGTVDASRIVVSSPGFQTDKGAVHIYALQSNNKYQFVQSIPDYLHIEQYPEYIGKLTFGDRLGDTVIMSEDGMYLFASSNLSIDSSTGPGKVWIYKWNGNQYNFLQRLDNPSKQIDLNFGKAISINTENTILSVTSQGTNEYISITFDGGVTTVDGSSCRIGDVIRGSGSAYVYNRYNEKFILAQELFDNTVDTDSHYGISVVVNDDTIYVGSPGSVTSGTIVSGSVYAWNEINKNAMSWELFREQPALVDIKKINKAYTLDSLKETTLDYLDIIDPLKGKIPGLADQDLKYKSPVDPAVYNVPASDLPVVVDSNSYWGDDHVGELWWDLSTAKFMWYEQGDTSYRKATWGKLFPGLTVDIYEWVASSYTPAEWATKADTNAGLAAKISGQPKYLPTTAYSTAEFFNKSTGQFSTTYYFWVKNKTIIPANTDRKLSANEVSKLIQDPKIYGLEYLAILGPNAVAVTNYKTNLISERIYLNVGFDNIRTNINRHTEWTLIQEDSIYTKIPPSIEQKFIDSLLGKDKLGNLVPDPMLPVRQRYGIEFRPRQSMFVNRVGALETLIGYANSVLSKLRIRGLVNFSKLNSKEEIPNILLGQYDQVLESIEARDIIVTTPFVQAQLSCTVANGKIIQINIDKPGYGYQVPPSVQVLGTNNSFVEIITVIDQYGQITDAVVKFGGYGFVTAPTLSVRPYSVIVQADSTVNNKWSLYSWSGTEWIRSHTQDFDTTAYWQYIDWKDANFNSMKLLSATVDELYQLDTLTLTAGDYVKVNNPGDGYYVILSKTDTGVTGTFNNEYNIVYVEKGTIQILTSVFDTGVNQQGFDDQSTFDQLPYDEIADLELKNIVLALKDDIFINNNKIYYNKIFFKGLRYALTEQKFLDWAFKTTFINVKNIAGVLDQRPTYRYQNTGWYENYLNEVKPYHTKIRNYQVNYTIGSDNNNQYEQVSNYATDFDIPSYYDKSVGNFVIVNTGSSVLSQYPWKSWSDNFGYSVNNISIVSSGAGYTVPPDIRIIPAAGDQGSGATAKAHIAFGKVSYIELLTAGSGYTQTPTAIVVGGGNTALTTATLYVELQNSLIRSTTVGLKFDRISYSTATSVVGTSTTVSQVFTATGANFVYTLTWYASDISLDADVKIDGITAISSDFKINSYEKLFTPIGSVTPYKKHYSELVLSAIPPKGVEIDITYKKNINLYSASERIRDYYQPDTGMPGKDFGQLMQGVDYPGVRVQGLPFEYSSAWDVRPFGQSSYSNDIDFYVSIPVAQTSLIGTTTTTLANTIGVRPGQYANIITYYSTASMFTTSTVQVTAVNTATNQVTFSSRFSQNVLATTGTSVEFYSFNDTSYDLDTVIDGGDLAYTTALGLASNEIILDGDKFLTPFTSHAPEELVPGQIQESLSISVFTRTPSGSPLIVHQKYLLENTTTSTIIDLNMQPASTSSVLVSFDGVGLTYGIDYTLDFIANTITINPQTQPGLVAIVIVGVGGSDILFNQGYLVNNVASVDIPSVIDYRTIGSVYVTVNGETVEHFGNDLGYTIQPTSNTNPSTILTITGLTAADNLIQVWYFQGTYRGFSEVKEQIITTVGTQTNYSLIQPPGVSGPYHGQAIVEVNGIRLNPPPTTYYEVKNNQTEYDIRPNETHPRGAFATGYLEVYQNGIRLQGNINWTLDRPKNRIIFADGVLSNGDVIAIVTTFGAAYLIRDNKIILKDAPTEGSILKILTFTNHDTSNIRTEVFPASSSNLYRMSRPLINDSYVWVTIGGKVLANRLDYRVLDDLITVEIDRYYEYALTDTVVITSFSDQLVDKTVGYRLFYDIFGTTRFYRISEANTAVLTQPLNINDTEIFVDNGDVLPNPVISQSIPGTVFIQGERIDYLTKNGNILGQLRRGTYGTAPKTDYPSGTLVVDQNRSQSVPTFERTIVQNHKFNSSTSTYTIHTNNSDGITLKQLTPIGQRNVSAEQVLVFVAGKLLHKSTATTHNIELGYDSTHDNLNLEDPLYYSIDVATQKITFTKPVSANTLITVIQKIGTSWNADGSSLLDGTTMQSKFLLERQSGLVGSRLTGNPQGTSVNYIYLETGQLLTDENNNPLEGN